MPSLLILSSNSDEYTQLIESAQLPDLEFTTEPEECDIVLGEPKLIRDMLPRLSNPKWVQAIYAGVERLMDPALRRDYILTNARGVFGELMSEYVFGYLLLHEKKILERRRAQRSKQWDRTESGVLRRRTMGLLGVGSIGSHLAGTAKHFGMSVHGFTRESEACADVDVYYHEPHILEFAKRLDYLVSVLPRTTDTNRIVNASLFDALPSHAIFINVGRGNVVDESALVTALNEGKIAAAILDVTENEPLPEAHPFWTTPNLLLSFHTSAISYPENISELFVENYQRYIEGKPLKYQVDFERGY
ncbi:MAG TPA: D-2-hydroxyacid dehydrogenase [Anaerolineales bacterium]|nr:D-2-hydroxyacid dehydrogenase [Anaerolineales bacterium]